MSYAENPYRAFSLPLASTATVNERTDFIKKTYAHLAGAIFAFAAIEAVLLNIPGIERVASLATSGFNWLIVLGAFIGVSWLADRWARSDASPARQYLGLGLYVVAESVIFVPLLYFAHNFFPDQRVIETAGVATLTVFGGLTAVVFISKKDFSFLRGALSLAGLVALLTIVGSMVFGFSLGLFFTVAMIAFAGGYVLYDTSNVLHHYRIGQHVAASLALFSSVALMFWYMVQLIMSLTSRD